MVKWVLGEFGSVILEGQRVTPGGCWTMVLSFNIPKSLKLCKA